MIITKEQARAITFDDSEEFNVLECAEWISQGKYEHCTNVFEDKGKYYTFYIMRSGSYHTDWYYDWETQDTFKCDEVKKVEVVTTKWIKV